MENDSLVCPTEKFPEKVELLKRYSQVGMLRMDFCVPLPRFLYFIPVPGLQKEICHGHLGKKWPSSQWISLQLFFQY